MVPGFLCVNMDWLCSLIGVQTLEASDYLTLVSVHNTIWYMRSSVGTSI